MSGDCLFSWLSQRRSAEMFAVISPTRLRESRDSAAQGSRVAVILMEYQRKQSAPIDALKRSDAQSLEGVNDQSKRAVPK